MNNPCQPVIRALRADDAEALNDLANQPGFRFGTLRMPFQPLAETRRWIERMDAGSLALVALIDDALVGQAGLVRLAGRQSHVGVLGMGVADAWTGRGIGTALLRAVIDSADRWMGLKRLQLTVFADNAAAIRLYERFGFTVEGRHRAFAFRDGRYVDALAMARLDGVGRSGDAA